MDFLVFINLLKALVQFQHCHKLYQKHGNTFSVLPPNANFLFAQLVDRLIEYSAQFLCSGCAFFNNSGKR